MTPLSGTVSKTACSVREWGIQTRGQGHENPRAQVGKTGMQRDKGDGRPKHKGDGHGGDEKRRKEPQDLATP